MLVYGVGRQTGKKNDKFENALIENEKLLETILQKRHVKDTYTTVNANTISSIVLDTNPIFMMLKSEIENFNKEVREALDNKAEMPNYSWKYSLNVGLRNLLKEIVVTEDRGLKVLFLEKAKAWYYDKMEKKGEIELPRPGTNQSTARPFTANTRPFTANTRPFTSQTNRGSDLNQNSINISVLPHEQDSVIKEKSFFENTARDEYLPSKIRAEILRDYDEGARTKHDSVEPPYERLSEYERKIPQGILKPSSRVGHRPQTSKTTTFAREANANANKFFLEKTNQTSLLGNLTNPADEEMSQGAGEEGEEGEGIEGEEGEGEGGVVPQVDPNEPRKPGIVQPKKKLYMNDKITSLQHNTKDLHIGMESRSNYAHYLPSNSLAELQLEQRWRNAMHKKTIEKREKQEFETMMKDWAYTKSRLEEEIHRRNESLTFGSRYKQRTFIPRSKSANIQISKKFTTEMDKTPAAAEDDAEDQTETVEDEEDDLGIRDEDEISEQDEEESPADLDTFAASKVTVYRETGLKKVGRPELYDFTKVRPKSVATGQEVGIVKTEPIEDRMNKDKIARITRLHSALIFGTRNVPADVGQDGAFQVDRPKSLSVYDQEKVLKYRPFSAVHQVAKPETFRKAQMEEIEEIKSKLAKFKIKVPVKQLKTSLLLPEVSKANSVSKLPNPGAGLMMNPFFKEKKGKKKKGSKKKR